MRGGELSKGQLTARKENFHSSRFTARSLCRNRGPCWSARPPSLRCALRFGLLFSRFSVPPSLRGLSSRHPIPCRRLLSRSRGLAACRARYLLGLPPPGAYGYFPAGVPGVFAFPVRRENIIANSLIVSQYKFAYSIITR